MDFFSTTVVISLYRLEPKGGMTGLTPVVGGTSISPFGLGTVVVFGLLVCNWNSSEDISVTGGDESCRGLFSLGTCGVVVGGTVVEGTVVGGACCSTSINVSGTHTV